MGAGGRDPNPADPGLDLSCFGLEGCKGFRVLGCFIVLRLQDFRGLVLKTFKGLGLRVEGAPSIILLNFVFSLWGSGAFLNPALREVS